MGCSDDSEKEDILPSPEIPELNKTPYIIPNDNGITTQICSDW